MSAAPEQSFIAPIVLTERLAPRWLLLAGLLAAGGCYTGESAREDAASSAAEDGTGGTAATAATAATGTGDATDGDDATGDETPKVVPAQPLHRLNRLEYNNTVRDLLGTTLRPADAFGPDPEANGFDNMSDQLHVSATVMDAYDQAARDVVANALDDVPAFQVRFTKDALAVPGGYTVGELWALSGNVLSVVVEVPALTQAEIVLDAGALVGGGAPEPTAQLQVNGVALPVFAVQGSAAVPAPHVQAISLAAGVHTISVVPTNYLNLPADNVFNNMFVAALTVRSTQLAPGPGKGLIYVCVPAGPEDAGCYAQIIHTFARRAWRRPLDPAEEMGLVDLWTQAQAQGESADGALRLVLRATLLSPKFFYRMRTSADADADGWLDDYVLASRLSYFLWSSMPDDRLLAMAADGRLATDEGLSEAVEFMLADPRASAMVDGFAEQWLSVRALAGYSPSTDAYPTFDADVRAAMAAESRMFFADFFANGLPIAALIQPDFAYRNDRLAAHYGLPGAFGPDFVEADFADRPYQGILNKAGLMTVLSHADHTSVVKRGKWVMENLLCVIPPPPPPGVDTKLEPLAGKTQREVLELHQSKPECASCHVIMDPLGFGLEHYDPLGAWRDDENGQPIDPSGTLPNGKPFSDGLVMQTLISSEPDFTRCVARKTFIYALGRGTTIADIEYIDGIIAGFASGQYRFADLVISLVTSDVFRQRRGDPSM